MRDYKNNKSNNTRTNSNNRNNRNDRNNRPDKNDRSTRFERPVQTIQKTRDFYEDNDNFEPSENTLILGRNAVLAAIESERELDKILIKDGDIEGSLKVIIAKAKEKGIKIEKIPKAKLDSLSTEKHQGIIAFAPSVEYSTVNDMLALAKKKNQDPFIIIAINIKDPHNLGALIRTAESAGAHGLIIPSRRAVGITGAVERASTGAVNFLPIAKVSNIAATIEFLKKQNIWIVGGDMVGTPYHSADLKGAVALCIGGEDEGLGQLVTKKCDFVVKIPMYGTTSSLNASVAGALLMYEVVRQRRFTS